MLNPNADLGDLINEPRETLDVEVKDWLDLTDSDHRAMIAKEIIALANHGGGFLVIGFEEGADGTFQPSACRPVNLDAWSQDNIQSIIAKYADPGVQCRVHHRDSTASRQKHPIIVVPGGHRVPIRAKAGAPDGRKLVAHRVYIRRPGPAREEPKTAEEWDRFLERCLQNRQAELLEAMRSIMAGVIPNAAPATPTRLDQLKAFEAQAIARWETLVAPLPVGVPPTLPCGHYDLLMAIDGDFERKSLSDLRDTIRQAVRNHSGWPPFVNLNRAPYAPKPVDGAIECWIGPDNDGTYDRPAHHEFWRISPDGILFTRRGYPEDGGWKGISPGTSFDITTSTWRLGEASRLLWQRETPVDVGSQSVIVHAIDCGVPEVPQCPDLNPPNAAVDVAGVPDLPFCHRGLGPLDEDPPEGRGVDGFAPDGFAFEPVVQGFGEPSCLKVISRLGRLDHEARVVRDLQSGRPFRVLVVGPLVEHDPTVTPEV